MFLCGHGIEVVLADSQSFKKDRKEGRVDFFTMEGTFDQAEGLIVIVPVVEEGDDVARREALGCGGLAEDSGSRQVVVRKLRRLRPWQERVENGARQLRTASFNAEKRLFDV